MAGGYHGSPGNQDSPFGAVVEALRRSTVTVRVPGGGAGRPGGQGRSGGPGTPGMPGGPGGSGGSGVIHDSGGGIVTAAHVARGERATVDLWDGTSFEAEVRSRDPGRDLALLQLRTSRPLEAPAVSFGDSRRLRPGELAIAIGNPLGFQGALSTGVIHSVSPYPGLGGRQWVVADIRLAPGNSGGPLANAAGEVIGINTMVSGGLAFAVPSSAVLTFLKRASAEEGGARLGVLVRPIVLRRRGAREGPLFCIQILEVEPGSAAAAASLRRGDLLVGANGEEFRSLDDLDFAIGSGDLLRLEFRRGDMRRTRTVSVPFGGRRPEAA